MLTRNKQSKDRLEKFVILLYETIITFIYILPPTVSRATLRDTSGTAEVTDACHFLC